MMSTSMVWRGGGTNPQEVACIEGGHCFTDDQVVNDATSVKSPSLDGLASIMEMNAMERKVKLSLLLMNAAMESPRTFCTLRTGALQLHCRRVQKLLPPLAFVMKRKMKLNLLMEEFQENHYGVWVSIMLGVGNAI